MLQQMQKKTKQNKQTKTQTTTKNKTMASTPEDFLGLNKVNEGYRVQCGMQLSGLAMLTKCTPSSIPRTTKPNRKNQPPNMSSSG